MAVVDNALYVDGRRVADPTDLEDSYRLHRAGRGMAWIGLYRPEPAEIRSMAVEFELHELAVEDAVSAHQRPKLERYGTTLFTVLRPARYLDEIEDQLFNGDHAVSRRIYELTREVIGFQRATHPLIEVLDSLEAGFDRYGVDIELRRNLRDVHDHLVRVVERADGFRALLQNLLSVQTTLVAQQQNDEMRSLTMTSVDQNEEVKKVSAWAAILFAPYPRRGVATSVTLYAVFKRRGWL